MSPNRSRFLCISSKARKIQMVYSGRKLIVDRTLSIPINWAHLMQLNLIYKHIRQYRTITMQMYIVELSYPVLVSGLHSKYGCTEQYILVNGFGISTNEYWSINITIDCHLDCGCADISRVQCVICFYLESEIMIVV